MDKNWRDRAACRGMNPNEFFPTRGTYSTQTLALKACNACPVTRECLEFALAFNEPGVWGGTSARERRKMRRERAAHG